MRSFDEGIDYKKLLLNDPEVTDALSVEEIEQAFDLDTQLRHVDAVFARVFERAPESVE